LHKLAKELAKNAPDDLILGPSVPEIEAEFAESALFPVF